MTQSTTDLSDQYIALVQHENPDFTDPQTERQYAVYYQQAHDALLDPETVRTIKQENLLAYLRALLIQRGVEESLLPWELSVSYNLRLAECLEKHLKYGPKVTP